MLFHFPQRRARAPLACLRAIRRGARCALRTRPLWFGGGGAMGSRAPNAAVRILSSIPASGGPSSLPGRRGGRPGAAAGEELRSEPWRPEGARGGRVAVREAQTSSPAMSWANRDDGASRIERDGQSWFRVAVTPKTIMTSLGPVTYRRAPRARDATRASSRDAAGHHRCGGSRRPVAASVSTRAPASMHGWETAETLGGIQAEGIPHDAPPRRRHGAAETRRATVAPASWRRRLRHGLLPRRRRQA